MKYTLDRTEGNIAVIEASDDSGVTILKVPIKYIGKDVKEGTILTFKDNMYVADNEATDKTRTELLEKLKRLKE